MHGITIEDKGLLETNAWHGLYDVLGRPIFSQEVTDLFSDFTFSQKGLGWVNEDGEFMPLENSSVVVRDQTGRDFYKATDRFASVPYAEYFGEIAELVSEFGFDILSAGTLNGGGRGFMSVKNDAMAFEIPGYSKGENVLSFGAGVDGQTPMLATVGTRLVVCNNTFQAYLLGLPKMWRIKNTLNGSATLEFAKRRLEESLAVSTGIQAAIDRLIDVTHTEDEFRQMTTHLISGGKGRPEDSGRGQTVFDSKFEDIIGRYNNSDIDPIRGTAMASLMAIQGYSQHVSQINSGGDREARALERSIFGGDKIAEEAAAYLKVQSLIKA